MATLCFFSDIVSPLSLPYLLEGLLIYFRWVFFIIFNFMFTIFGHFNASFDYSKDSDMTQADALKYGSAICFMAAVPGIAYLHYFYLVFLNGVRIRVAVCSLIYRKVS